MNEETASNEFIGQLATFTGWTLKSETVSPYVLKKADVMVLKNEGCLVHDGPGQICVEAICGVKKYSLFLIITPIKIMHLNHFEKNVYV